MAADNPVAANLPSVMLSWASPVSVDEAQNEGRETAVLLRSSPNAWLQTDLNVLPDYGLYPDTGFAPAAEHEAYPLAVSLSGRFQSYYQDKPSPFESGELPTPALDPTTGAVASPPQPINTLTESPESSRLVVIGSAAFAEDDVLNLAGFLNQSNVTNNLQFLQNVVDWSVEDLDLLAIRGRGTATHVLLPMTEQQQAGWEIANYVIALLALVAVYVSWRRRTQQEKPLVLATQSGD
jgi:ABC-2 type transport system permease protein